MPNTEPDLVEARVHTMPPCNFAETDEWECDNLPDRFDFMTQQGPWAFGCKRHYEVYRLYRDLGTGKGQRLVLADG